MNDVFSDKEKMELEKLNDNSVLLSALKKIILADIYVHGQLSKDKPMGDEYMQNYAFSLSFDARTGNEFARSNEDLGKALRASNEALRIVNIAFQRIGKFKKVVEIEVDKKPKHV